MVALLQIIYDKITDRSRGFAFVTMATAEEATKAVQMFNGAVSFAPVSSPLNTKVCSCSWP
jgi:RNA recognition motif-containing protein